MLCAVEPLATACNVLSNVVVLHTTCQDTTSPMPRAALALQVCANLSWFVHATITRDAYLGTTAFASLALQVSSLVLRCHWRRNTVIRLEPSCDELQRFPPP